ncbi:MAG: ATP-grasp domain-containing protein [Planctomycetaceae bacterium]
MRHLLLTEFLHADAASFSAASASMKREGRAMLEAVAADLIRVPGVELSVILCEAAVNQVALPPATEVRIVADSDWQSAAVTVASQFPLTELLLIAPECDGVLERSTSHLRAQGVNVWGPSPEVMAIGCNKWLTYEFLRRHNIATIPTRRLSGPDGLPSDWDCCVVKPVDGAGCEGIVRCSRAAVREMMSTVNDPSKWVVQPWLEGRSCSVGIIGQGPGQPPVVLPLAGQSIQWTSDRPAYLGGIIPAECSSADEQQLMDLLQVLLEVLNIDCGYVGIDLLQTTTDGVTDWLITEINPRLCSSYIGYRRLAMSNPAELMLQESSLVQWNSERVVFRVN